MNIRIDHSHSVALNPSCPGCYRRSDSGGFCIQCEPTLKSGVPPWLEDGSIDVPLEPDPITLRMVQSPPSSARLGGDRAFWRGTRQTFCAFVVFVVIAYFACAYLVSVRL